MNESMALNFIDYHLELRISNRRRSLMLQHIFSGPTMWPLPGLGAAASGVNQAQLSLCKIPSRRGSRHELISNGLRAVTGPVP